MVAADVSQLHDDYGAAADNTVSLSPSSHFIHRKYYAEIMQHGATVTAIRSFTGRSSVDLPTPTCRCAST